MIHVYSRIDRYVTLASKFLSCSAVIVAAVLGVVARAAAVLAEVARVGSAREARVADLGSGDREHREPQDDEEEAEHRVDDEAGDVQPERDATVRAPLTQVAAVRGGCRHA